MLRWFGGFLRRGTAPTASASISIETMHGVATPVIVRGAPLPVEHTEVFGTARDDQDRIEIRLYQGERALAQDNRVIGTFAITGIPLAAQGQVLYDVTFRLDEEGAFTLHARDHETGQAKTIEVEHQADAADAHEIEKLLADAALHEEADRAILARLEARRELARLVTSADDTFAPIQDRLTLEQNEALAKALIEAAQILDEEDATIEQITAARTQLDAAFQGSANALN